VRTSYKPLISETFQPGSCLQRHKSVRSLEWAFS